jgi:indole-3-acetate monooxygenase
MRDVFVPEDRAVSLITDQPLARPLYAFPVFGLLAIGISAVSLGLARAAVDELKDLAAKKTPEGRLKPLAQSSHTHREIAEAEALIGSARAYLWDTVARAYDAAQETGELTVDLKRDVRLAGANAARAGAQAVDIAYNLAGGTSVYRKSPIQRHFRDVHVTTQHMMVGPMIWEKTGRLFLGLDDDVTML